MITEGQVVLFKFPQTDQVQGKLRPALILRSLPDKHGDWLICMISSQTFNFIDNLDEQISQNHADFKSSGLKLPSIIRVTRLAVVNHSILLGKLGQIDHPKLNRLKKNLCNWID